MASTKAATPETALTLFLNPSRKYMAHFFHFMGDVPAMRTESKGSKTKVVFETKRPKLYLSDIDAICKKYEDMKGKRSLEEISIGVLSVELLEALEAAKLELGQVIAWAKTEATTKLAAAPKAAKAPKAPADPRFNTLVKMLIDMEPGKAPGLKPAELRDALIALINDTDLLNQAVAKLGTLEPDSKTYRLRLRAEKTK